MNLLGLRGVYYFILFVFVVCELLLAVYCGLLIVCLVDCLCVFLIQVVFYYLLLLRCFARLVFG